MEAAGGFSSYTAWCRKLWLVHHKTSKIGHSGGLISDYISNWLGKLQFISYFRATVIFSFILFIAKYAEIFSKTQNLERFCLKLCGINLK